MNNVNNLSLENINISLSDIEVTTPLSDFPAIYKSNNDQLRALVDIFNKNMQAIVDSKNAEIALLNSTISSLEAKYAALSDKLNGDIDATLKDAVADLKQKFVKREDIENLKSYIDDNFVKKDNN
jgi:hypothetical protein